MTVPLTLTMEAFMTVTHPSPRRFTERMETPEGFSVYEKEGQLVIRRRWFTQSAFLLLAFCIGIPAVGYFAADSTFSKILVCIAFAALGYVTLCQFLNRTDVVISADWLKVKTGPLPWSSGVSVTSTEISQVYCKRHAYKSDNTNYTEFQLVVKIKKGNQERILIKDTFTSENGKYFEKMIEKTLGIKNESVEGEYDKLAERKKHW